MAREFGLERPQLRLVRQVHGAAVAVVRRGGESTWTPPEADVIVSDDPRAAIVVRVADCAPILLADRRLRVVAAAHSGWRGTVHGVAARAVTALRENFGSTPGDLIVAIGPCLGECCGEVGPEVVETFRRAGYSNELLERWFRPGAGDRSQLDLSRATRDQLASAGVPPEQIYDAAICTKTHSRLFHSYRADGAGAGRMAAVIRVKEEGGSV